MWEHSHNAYYWANSLIALCFISYGKIHSDILTGCSKALTALQHVRMQPHFLLPTGGHVCPKLSTSFIKFRAFTNFSNGKLCVCHSPQGSHQIPNQYFRDVRQVRISSKQLYICNGNEPRYITTAAAFAESQTIVHDIPAAGLPSGVGSTGIHESSLFTKLPGNVDGSITRYSPTKRWIGDAQHPKRNKRERRKRLCSSTAAFLTEWLGSDTRSSRAAIWAKHLKERKKISLSSILLGYLEAMDNKVATKDTLEIELNISESTALRRQGFSQEDLQLWARILTTPNDNDIAQRYLSIKHKIPPFVSLQFLRRPRLSSRLFSSLMIHSRDYLMELSATDLLSVSVLDTEDVTSTSLSLPSQIKLASTADDGHALEPTTFMVLVSHLLRHARQVLAPAIVNISRMVVSYCHRVAGSEANVSPEIHKRLCQIYNMMLRRLSLPASVNPMNSMAYNRQAQRILLASAARFEPPLQFDKSSYHAVSRVLVASRKSPSEERHAALIQRTWPPWRKDLDGTDIDRSPEEDISRAVIVLTRMKEAGHAEVSSDKALKMLGGREPDWSPTVQTRYLTKFRRVTLQPRYNTPWKPESEEEWAARITATRDVYEAWEGFQAFLKSGQPPSHSMYYAMFQKLIFNSMTDPQRQGQMALPGDGKEVLPVLDDNISESEKLRMQPPSLDTLFQRMIVDGIRPSGRLLELLVSKAHTLKKVALYLHHGAVPPEALSELLNRPSQMRLSALKRIPDGTFVAFIEFLCRSRRRFSKHPWLHPTLHAFELVRRLKPLSPVAWYLVFRALARRGEVFNEYCNQHLNDIMSWRMLEMVFVESKEAGVQLDPDGFRYICMGLIKALLATPHVPEEASSSVRNGQMMVKELFATLTDGTVPTPGLPRLSHRLSGFHLHAYIRVLGLLQDTNEILLVLEWMAEHQEELIRVGEQSRNGSAGFRRSLVAIRSFLPEEENMDDDLLGRLKSVMDELEGLGGWPTDEEVENYRRINQGEVSEAWNTRETFKR